jgi:uncharacterized protein (DUF1800 family)
MERREFLTAGGALGALGLMDVSVPKLARGGTPTTSTAKAAWRMDVNPQPLSTKSNDLTPYAGPWQDRQIRHALRRAMFGVPFDQFMEAKSLGSMTALVNKLIDPSIPMPEKTMAYVDELLLPKRTDAQIDNINKNRTERFRTGQVRNWWFELMLREHLSIREKMTLMWHNHFVVSGEVVQFAGLLYTYLDTLRRNSLGNVKQMAHEITVDPAMLIYLNGNQSYYGKNPQGKTVGNQVNENYARELMELFTLGLLDPVTGEPNYTEEDVQNAAQALSGWQFSVTAPFKGVFFPQSHNNENKTFFGQTGNWNEHDIVEMIFAKKGGFNAAYFICEKIYTTFVYYVPNKSVVSAMAQQLVASNWEVTPVLKALFSSDHFYDEEVIGAQLKSGAEFIAGLARDFSMKTPPFDPKTPESRGTDPNGQILFLDPNSTHSNLTFIYMGGSLGQMLLEPPNVKGWPNGHSWVSTGSYPVRDLLASVALLYPNRLDGSGQSRGISLKFDPMAWARAIDPDDAMDSQTIAKALERATLQFELGPIETDGLYKTLNLLQLPEDDFYLKEEYISLFAINMATLPEYQLL